MNRLKLLSVTFLALLVASPRDSHSQTTVNSDPVGFVTVTVNAGRSNAPIVTAVSPVLLKPSQASGATAGVISSVSSNSVGVTSAGWSNNTLAAVATPTYLMLTSGTQQGLILRITANTSNSLTLENFGLNLASNQVSSGNSFRLVVGETLRSFFGSPTNGVVGGTLTQFNNRQTDQVILPNGNGILTTYYFNTDANGWRLPTSQNISQDNVALPIAAGAIYRRVATSPISFVRTGTVPVQNLKNIVRGNNTMILGRFFPTDGTVSGFNIQSLPGWGSDDRLVYFDSNGAAVTCSWNSTRTNWVRVGGNTNVGLGGVSIPAGRALYVIRGAGKTPQIVSVNIPYNL